MQQRARRHLIRILMAVVLAVMAAGAPAARADDSDVTPTAPRSSVEIGGVGVVLIVANGKLHAFADRLDTNAPADDVSVIVTLAEGRALPLVRVTEGLFVGPFDPGTRKRDSFLVSVTGADGTGEAMTEITYDAGTGPVAAAGDGMQDKVLIAVVAGTIGLLLGLLVVRRRGSRQAAERAA